jgi:hypothetical protein
MRYIGSILMLNNVPMQVKNRIYLFIQTVNFYILFMQLCRKLFPFSITSKTGLFGYFFPMQYIIPLPWQVKWDFVNLSLYSINFCLRRI